MLKFYARWVLSRAYIPKQVGLWLLCLLFSFRSMAQPPLAGDTLLKPLKFKLATAGLAVGYTGLLVGLSQTWYAQSEKTSFHFFNDIPEWLQIDKVGHFYGAFHESRVGVTALRAAGLPEKKAVIYGSLLGFVLQSPIELLDGYAADYGASAGDLGANALGSAAVLIQHLTWGELKIIPKFSFHRTAYAHLRPQLLGRSLPEEILKDYNGQTYWLSTPVFSLFPAGSQYPKWLNLALGYGGQQLVYGMPSENRQHGFAAYRQYYLALDLNFEQIKTRYKALRAVFYLLNLIHVPAPALEFNSKQGFRFHPLYF